MALVEDEKWRKILKTFQDVAGSISGKALEAFESVGDLGTRAVALTGEVFGADTQKIWDFADKDLVEDWYYKPLGINQRDSESYLNDWKYGETVRQVSGMAGGLAGSIIMGGMAKGLVPAGASDFVKGAIGTLPIGLKQAGFASGKASQELKERNEGQDISFGEKTKAMAYGTMSGLAEWGISNISGAGEIAGLGPKDSFKEIAKGALGEGFETILSNVADPILKKMTYAPETNVLLDDSENIKERAGDIGKEALIATLLSGGIQTAQYGAGKLASKHAENKLEKKETRREKAEIDEAEYLMRENDKIREKTIAEMTPEEQIKNKLETQEVETEELPIEKIRRELETQPIEQEEIPNKVTEEIPNKVTEEIPGKVTEEIPSKTSEELFEELKADEYSIDPYRTARETGGNPVIDNLNNYIDENKMEGPEYESQAKKTMLENPNLTKKQRKTIEREVDTYSKSEFNSDKKILTDEWFDKNIGLGDDIDPFSEPVKALIGTGNKDNDLAVAILGDRVADALETATGDRKTQLENLEIEIFKKNKELREAWGKEGNEIKFLNTETATGSIVGFEKMLDNMFERDSAHSYKKNKIDKTDYEITAEKRQTIRNIWNEAETNLEQAKADGRLDLADTIIEKRNKQMYLEATKDVPVKLGEKLKEWRQVGFLFNARTMLIRNPLGNVEAMALDKTNFMKTIINKLNKHVQGIDTSMNSSQLKEYNRIYADTLASEMFGLEGTVTNSNKYQSEISYKGLSRDHLPGKIADFTYNMLDRFDTPFEKATYAAELYRSKIIMQNAMESGKIKNISEDTLDLMAHRAAQQKADVITYKDDNSWTEAMVWTKNKLNNIFHFEAKYGMGVGDQLVTFLKTPTNVAKMAYDHLPISLIKSTKAYSTALKELNKSGSAVDLIAFDKASQEVAKGAYGTTLLLAAGALAHYGILESNEHERGQQDQTTFNKQKLGKQGLSLKIGDTRIPLGNFNLANILLAPAAKMSIEAKKLKESDDKDKEAFKTIVLAGVEQQVESILEQASLKTFNQWLEGYQANGAEGFAEAVGRTLAGIPAEYIPTKIQQTAKAIDPYERQVFEKGMFGNAMNQVIAGIPFLRETLPEKVDVYGEKIKNFDDTESFVKHVANKTILPSEVKTVDDSFITQEIERVGNATGENVYPYAVRSREDGKNLTAQEISDKQKVAGQRFVKNAEALFETNKYKEATDEEKAEMLKNLAKTPSKKEMKYGEEEIQEEDYGEATTFNMLSKSGINPQYLKDIKYAGGNQQDKIEQIASLDISGEQKIILFKTLYPDSKEIPDETVLESMMNTGMSKEEILNYGKMLGLVLDDMPLQYDTEVEDREAYNEMRYGLKAIDEKDTMKNAVYQVLPENAPEIIKEASSLAKNEEQLVNYLSKLEIDGIQKLILYKRMVPKKDEGIDDTIAEYIVGLDMSDEQKKRILRELKII